MNNTRLGSLIFIFFGITQFYLNLGDNLTLSIYLAVKAFTISYLFMNRENTAKYDISLYRYISYASAILPLFYTSGEVYFDKKYSIFINIIIIIAYTFSIFSLLVLNKSFGISPAKRTIVKDWPYSFIKHPAYVGYATSELCIILLNLNYFNLIIFSVSIILYVVRARRENHILYS